MIRRNRVRLAGLLLPAVLGAVMVGALTTVGGAEARGPAGSAPVVAQGGMVPADCLCGGPGGSASLAHISPWLNSDCNTSISVGTSNVYVYVSQNGSLVRTYAGWSDWRYSSYRSCHGYQWVRYHLTMSVVHRSTVSGGFATMIWLSQDALDWTTFTTNFTGGASDGAFSTYAVMAGPLTTTAGIWTSLAQFGPNRNWTSA